MHHRHFDLDRIDFALCWIVGFKVEYRASGIHQHLGTDEGYHVRSGQRYMETPAAFLEDANSSLPDLTAGKSGIVEQGMSAGITPPLIDERSVLPSGL